MRSTGFALVWLAACAERVPAPAAPVQIEAQDPPVVSAAGTPDECPDGAPTLRVKKRQHSTPVAGCQVAPVDVDVGEAAKVFVRARSAETVTEATLHDQGEYRAGWTEEGLQVMDASGKPLAGQSEKTREIRALAASIVGWPAHAALRPLAVGQELPELVDPIQRVVDLRIRDEPTATATHVRFQGTQSRPWGAALIFEVVMDGESSSAGMCHRWATVSHASGELVLRATDGAVVAVHLHGTWQDTEALCPEGARQAGSSTEPKTCARGEMSFDLSGSCAARSS